MTDRRTLHGRVAPVPGGSRGVGKGIAEALAEAGATVYVTGRTVAQSEFAAACIPILCDHADDAQVESAFARVLSDQGRLDVLANSVWGGYEGMIENGQFTWTRPFWQQPVYRWDAMSSAGVRAYYVARINAFQVSFRLSLGTHSAAIKICSVDVACGAVLRKRRDAPP